MKTCFKCGEAKGYGEFYRHPAMADGHLGKCKICTRADVAAHRRENDHVQEYDRRRARTRKVQKRIQAVAKNWRAKNPDKARAHSAVGHALRSGKLTRLPCEGCGDGRLVHAHHDDYSKPLEVRWLCPKCHQRHHASEAA